ncbi:hypothetical protein [Actinophytocola sp.]|uniref:hypothetical protein n=1 Tax=Actinophytocola sp. TaxID=1872138 RepID=UPI002ED22924
MRKGDRRLRIKAALLRVRGKATSVRRRRSGDRRHRFVRKTLRFILAAIIGDSVVRGVALLWHFLVQLFSG